MKSPKHWPWKNWFCFFLPATSVVALLVPGFYFDLLEPDKLADHVGKKTSANAEFVSALLLVVVGMLCGVVFSSSLSLSFLERLDKSLGNVKDLMRLKMPDHLMQQFVNASNHLETIRSRFGGDARQETVVNEYVRRVVVDLENACRRLTQDEVESDYDDCNLLTDGVNQLKPSEELLGITFWNSDHDWWKSEDAEKFRAANYAAAKRRVSIRRVFVYDANQYDATMDAEINAQKTNGIKTRKIAASNLPAGVPPCCSLCVVGDFLTYHVVSDSKGVVMRNQFSLVETEISKQLEVLTKVWDKATDC